MADQKTSIEREILDNKRISSAPVTRIVDPNGNGSGSSSSSSVAKKGSRLVHSVSIIVEPVLDEMEPSLQEAKEGSESSLLRSSYSNDSDDSGSTITTSDTTLKSGPSHHLVGGRKERIHSSPLIVMDDHFLGKKDKIHFQSICFLLRLTKNVFHMNNVNRIQGQEQR